MSKPDIRWKQRFENYTKAVGQMTRFIEKGDLNEMEEQGLIQSFEYTYELAWTTLKDFFEDRGRATFLAAGMRSGWLSNAVCLKTGRLG